MKKMSLLLIAVVLIAACKQNNEAEIKTVEVASSQKSEIKEENLAKAEFSIEGMTCAIGCAATIQKNLNKKNGVKTAKVDFDKKLAMVEYDKTQLELTDLAMVVTETADTYKVLEMEEVDAFGKTGDSSKAKECAKDCEMACCKEKKEGESMACAEDCKKECCKQKKA